jgi:acetyl-CoA C-acetyltransferase
MVTAGNASGIVDGAAAVVVMAPDKARADGRAPLVEILDWATVGVDPSIMGIGPVPAIRQALARAGLGLGDVDLFEINEAFAVVALACAAELAIPHEKLNVRGGAVALGHPIGASGARIVVTLIDALAERNQRYGCAGICIGGGEATALVIERLAG